MPPEASLPCDDQLRKWHVAYSPTLKPTYVTLTDGHIKNHLIPHFGTQDMREIREADLLGFIQVKLKEGLRPRTVRNILATLRRVYTLLEREELVSRNPTRNIGELMRGVGRSAARETEEVEHWTQGEVERLLAVAREHEPRFGSLLLTLFSTGMRRGEALGLKWSDIDFDSRRIAIRRAITTAGLTTPKSGRSRRVILTEALAEVFFDLYAERRKEALSRGWKEIPEWVFCSETGTAPDPSNVERCWRRVKRRAQKERVRPLKLHCTRHTWATFALQAGKNIRWVADQLGHSDPALTLRVYSHAMREEEHDVSFAEFGVSERLYTSPALEGEDEETANCPNSMARREGLEPPTLRFEA